MPTYQYRCTNCSHEFEAEQRIIEDPLKKCPECATESLQRIIGEVGIAFKGSGFHITDYSKKKTNNKAEAASSQKTSPQKK
jgi:putative FmdB family regulatory protein